MHTEHKIVYDVNSRYLLYYKPLINGAYWDNHWSEYDILNTYRKMNENNFFTRKTNKYLKSSDGPILEGGCGIGQVVYSLCRAGYDCVGVDTARETIEKILALGLELKVDVMDVAQLEYSDNHFSGYWSLGVIEHNLAGYEKILDEMVRVVKPGGYVFLTVPIINTIRKLKIAYKKYPEVVSLSNVFDGYEFHQYVFPYQQIIYSFTQKGMKLVEFRRRGGIKGLKDDLPDLGRYLSCFSTQKKSGRVRALMNRAVDIVVSPLSGHIGFFVFRNEKTKEKD